MILKQVKKMKKLGDAEFEIMEVLWKHDFPLTSNEILDEIIEKRNWKLPSLMTVLSRLAEKGFVNCDRSTRTNYYNSLVSEKEYKVNQSESFLEQMYSRSAQKFIAGLYQGKKLSSNDIKELRKYLDSLEKDG